MNVELALCENDAQLRPLQQRQDAKSSHLLGSNEDRPHLQSPSCDLVHLGGLMGAVCVFTADTLV